MPFSGGAGAKTFSRNTGVYTGTSAWAQTDAAVRGIRSDDHDTHDQDIATALNTSLQKNGDNSLTASIPAAGFGMTGIGVLGSATEASITSASTADLLGSAALFNLITGTVTITSLGTGANRFKIARFNGILTLTHNGTSLILPGGASITTADGDTMGVISDASSNVRVIWYQRTASATNPSAPGFRNIARRNGGLEVWQRGAGGAASIAVAASTTAYTADGCYLVTAANEASVVSQQAGLTNGSQWCARVQRNSGQTGTGGMTFGFPFDTDELYPMLGQFVRLSLTLKAGANWSPTSGNITIALNVGTGTPVKFTVGYTGATVAATLTQAITSSAVRYQVNSAAVIPTTTRQAEITLTWSPVGTASTNDYFEIDDVQLEIVPAAAGYVASDFERLNFHEQLQLCRRHYQKSFLYGTAPAQNVGINTNVIYTTYVVSTSSGKAFLPWRLPVTMRVAPTVTLYNPAATNAQARDSDASADCSATSASSITIDQVPIGTTASGSSSSPNIIQIHAQADSGI